MEGYQLYQTIRDDRRNQQDQEQAKVDLAQFAKDPSFEPDYSKYSDPSRAEKMGNYLKGQRDLQFQQSSGPVLQDFARGYQSATGSGDFTDPASMEVLAQEGVRVPSLQEMRNPYIREGVNSIGQAGQLQADLTDSYAGNATPQALARIATNPIAQKQHNAIATQQTAQGKAEQRAASDAAIKANSGFQDAIAGLSGPSRSPFDLKRFAARQGYDTAPGVESDIRQAAADYNVPATAVNQEIDNLKQLYGGIWLPPESGTVGRTSYTGQRNLLGDFRKDAQSTAPVTNITVQGNRDRTAEFNLRKEFLALPEIKDYPTIEANSRRALAALKEQGKGSNVAVDQTIIITLNKMLDPSSVVRESEYARTPQDLALLSKIKGKFDKLASGGAGLTPDERLALNRMITNFSTIASKQYNARAGEYRQLAKDYGFDPSRVVVRQNGLDEDRKEAPAVTPQQAAAELARRKGGGK